MNRGKNVLKKTTYDKALLTKISKLCHNFEFEQARKLINWYKENYPNDFLKLSFSEAFLYAYEGKYDDAIGLYKRIVSKCDSRNSCLVDYLYLLMELGNYKNAFEILEKIDLGYYKDNYFETYKRIIRVKFMLEKEFNIIDNNDYSKDFNYSYSQTFNYSEEKALHHVYSHHNLYLGDKGDGYCFFMDFDKFSSLFMDVLNKLNSARKTFKLDSVDYYYFEIADVGYNYEEDIRTDVLLVITSKNTKQILTMFPIGKIDSDYIVLNGKKQEFTSLKVRVRKSKIDKFNSKYNL